MTASVVITDGDERASLAAARSLVTAGCEVHVAAAGRRSLAGVSSGVRPHLVAADPLSDPAGYAAAIGVIAKAAHAAVLLPMTDQTVDALLTHRDRLPEHLVIPGPSLEAFRAASDKLRIAELARVAGFEVPETVVVGSPSDVPLLVDGLFPAVAKPHRSLVLGDSRRKVNVAFVADRASCAHALAALPAAAFPVLLQHRVQGPGEGLFILRWDRRNVAVFAHRRLREKPPAGGVSVYRESIAMDPALLDAGTRLLEGLGWNGVAMIECKRNQTTGRHSIMEINGRLWGSLQLAIDAGVDFPALLVRCAVGEQVAPVHDYRIGVRSRWFWGDVDHLYLRLRRSDAALHLLPGGPTRVGALLAFARFRPGRDRCEVGRWRDPAPFLLETARRLRLAR